MGGSPHGKTSLRELGFSLERPTSNMKQDHLTIAIYHSHPEAEAAIKELQHSGFDMKKLSIVGRNYHTDEHVIGYSEDSVLQYETALKADKFVVIAHGTSAEAEQAREVINRTAHETVEAHQAPSLEAEALAEATVR